MTSEAFQMIQKGVAAAKAGKKTQARTLLQRSLELDPTNETAWLWLAGVADSHQDAVNSLERVLELNPNNTRARAGLQQIQAKLAPASPPWQCPLCFDQAPEPQEVCPHCKAELTLNNLDSLLNPQVEGALLQVAVTRLEKEIRQADTYMARFYLGLAYVQLAEVEKGVEHLQMALRAHPEPENLAAQLEALVNRAQAIKRAAMHVEDENQPLVLAVDDSATVRRLIEITLKKYGYRVALATDGLEALALLSEKQPALILLDITMPRMDGYQLCRAIKENPKTQKIPVVMLSGKDGFFDKVRARMAGSTEYITKPFEPATLFQTVRKYAAI